MKAEPLDDDDVSSQDDTSDVDSQSSEDSDHVDKSNRVGRLGLMNPKQPSLPLNLNKL